MHANTRLTTYSRQWLMEQFQEGVPVKTLAVQHHISRTTFYRWWRRFRLLGAAGLSNRSSRPHRIAYRCTTEQVDRLLHLRQTTRHGPARLAPVLGISRSTAYRCLRRQGLHRLPMPPRPPVIRYESQQPGELVHLDVLHLFALKGQRPAYQFTFVDGYSRMAYACIASRHTTDVALAAVQAAQQAFGFPIQRLLTDNDATFAWTPRSHWAPRSGTARFTSTIEATGIRHSLTRIRRPQTNGKVERFHRTIQEELYRPHPLFTTEQERHDALNAYLTYYNTQRPHTALGGLTPPQRRDAYVSTTS